MNDEIRSQLAERAEARRIESENRKKKFKTAAIIAAVAVLILILILVIVSIAKKPDNEPETPQDDLQQAEINIDEYNVPDKLKKLYKKEESAQDFVLGYEENKGREPELDLSEYENTEEIPLLMQWDTDWGYTVYGSEVMGMTGCGPTCLSMVAIYLTGNTMYSPYWCAQFAEEAGYAVEGNGTSWTLFSEGAKKLGLDVTEHALVEAYIVKAIEAGRPVVCVMGPGHFTETGHYIVLTGYKDGKFVVNDPYSYENSNKLWAYEDIEGEIENIWSFGLKE